MTDEAEIYTLFIFCGVIVFLSFLCLCSSGKSSKWRAELIAIYGADMTEAWLISS